MASMNDTLAAKERLKADYVGQGIKAVGDDDCRISHIKTGWNVSKHDETSVKFLSTLLRIHRTERVG